VLILFISITKVPTVIPNEVIRSTEAEKKFQIESIENLWKHHESKNAAALESLKQVALKNGNLFAELMETVKYCSLGQIAESLFNVGGQYRRNM